MRSIPSTPLLLGLLGLLPFLAAALSSVVPLPLPRVLTGPGAGIAYGIVILCFMSGVLWGFASNGDSRSAYGFSVLPALWVFFTTGGAPIMDIAALVSGFLGVLILDHWFVNQALAPAWWLPLRRILTVVVVLCLSVCAVALL